MLCIPFLNREFRVYLDRIIAKSKPPRAWIREDGVGVMFDAENFPVGLIKKPDHVKWILNSRDQMTSEETDLFVRLIERAYCDWKQPGHGRWQLCNIDSIERPFKRKRDLPGNSPPGMLSNEFTS